MKPALTAEEWAAAAKKMYVDGELEEVFVNDGLQVSNNRFEAMGVSHPDMIAATAALALHGQPFGFSWEDVERLYGAANTMDGDPSEPRTNPILAGYLCDLADRIAALLPPREESRFSAQLIGADGQPVGDPIPIVFAAAEGE